MKFYYLIMPIPLELQHLNPWPPVTDIRSLRKWQTYLSDTFEPVVTLLIPYIFAISIYIQNDRENVLGVTSTNINIRTLLTFTVSISPLGNVDADINFVFFAWCFFSISLHIYITQNILFWKERFLPNVSKQKKRPWLCFSNIICKQT